MLKYIVAFFLIVAAQNAFANLADSIPRKNITIKKVSSAPKIDGILDDEAWLNAPIASGFIERNPTNGRPIPDSLRTEVKIIYDDLGIYFGATMNDPYPEKIMKELTQRDNIGADDFFFILLNGYNDRQQSMQFIVTAAGVQYDAKMTNGNEDNSWNAVWYSEIQINDSNWVAEIFIPYFELRFPKKDIQEWGLNMEREFHRTRTRYSWSHVDNTKGSYSIYDGEVYGIENIKTPTRLSFQPYISSYINNYNGQTEVNFNGGMDLKYGINDAFTLDMVLIPDFGQAGFDESVLNLSAFEVQFDEQRPFFTEGTELFTKGDLFYSRRVGGAPVGSVNAKENEEVFYFPSSVNLINAAKISGRTDKGLGIGFFNAITEKTYATIRNIETEETREELVEPLTNYNILVLDQRFGDNSSVSFVNTNTTRKGDFRDANASGAYLSLTNKNNTWNYRASAEGSWVLDESTQFGMEAQTGLAKISGKNRVEAGMELRTIDYNINDLGYSSVTNYVQYFGYYGYRLLQPKGFLNNMFLNFNLRHERRLEPDLFSSNEFNFNSSFTTKNFFNFGGGFETTFDGINDIYEPRVNGRHVKVPGYYDQWLWFSTDYRKKLAIEVVADWYQYYEPGRRLVVLEASPNYRISNQLNLNFETNYIISSKEQGFVDFDDAEIIFGQRTRTTIINSLGGNYIFNNKIALNLAFRHYFSEAAYTKFYELEENGDLTVRPEHENTYNVTFNTWNLDLRFSWWFAPGSQMTILYRNAMDSFIKQTDQHFEENFEYLFNSPQLNTVSLRISYFLNYNRIRNQISTFSALNKERKSKKMGLAGLEG